MYMRARARVCVCVCVRVWTPVHSCSVNIHTYVLYIYIYTNNMNMYVRDTPHQASLHTLSMVQWKLAIRKSLVESLYTPLSLFAFCPFFFSGCHLQ